MLIGRDRGPARGTLAATPAVVLAGRETIVASWIVRCRYVVLEWVVVAHCFTSGP
jgi:hypothetical protein